MLRFEYPYSYDYRLPVTPQLGVGVYFPSFPPNATVMNGDGSDSEQSSFDDFNNNNFSNDDNNNNNNMIMNDNNDNNNNNNEPINEEPSLLPDSLPSDNVAPSSEYYATTPLFSPKTMNASNDYSTTTTPNHRNSISISVPSDDLSVFVMGEGGNESKNELVTDINEFPTVDLLPPPMTSLPPLPVGTVATASETDDEELFRAKKQKSSNDTTTIAPKKSTARRGRKSAAAKAAEAAAAAAVTSTTSLSSSSASSSVAAVAAAVSVAPPVSENHRKTSTGSDEDNDYSDSPHSSHHSSSEHYRTKHSISETRRRTRLRNQFKYLAEASASAKTDRYSVLCAAIVKIEAAKRRIAELEAQVAAATVGSSMAGLSPMPAVSSAPSAMCCAESIEYGVCSQCSGVATALLSGDGVGTFLSANHRWLSLIGVNSLPELQSIAPSFLKVVGTSNAEVSNARSTLSAVSAHKHGSMTLPLDSNTILAYKNHSDSSIEPALLYANIRHFPTKSCRPALFTLSSYEHGAADNRNPCVLVTAVPCEPLPEGVTVSSYNDRLAHRGRKAGGGHTSPPASDSSSSINNNATNGSKKEGKKRSYSQRVASSRLNGGEGEGFALNARIGNQLMMDEGL